MPSASPAQVVVGRTLDFKIKQASVATGGTSDVLITDLITYF